MTQGPPNIHSLSKLGGDQQASGDGITETTTGEKHNDFNLAALVLAGNEGG